MANGTKHRTYYEGDDDGSVLQALAKAGLLPPDLEIVQRQHRKKNPGKEGMVTDIAALVNPAGGAGRSAVAVRDFDELSVAQIQDWFTDTLVRELRKITPLVQVLPPATTGTALLFRVEAPGHPHVGRVVGVAAGIPGGIAATEYAIAQFAIDDYILLLARERTVYESISEFRGEGVSYDLAMEKLTKVVGLMKDNGIPIKHTKRLMHLLRAVTGFRASPATFAERLVEEGLRVLGSEQVRSLFLPLIAGLEEASRLLNP